MWAITDIEELSFFERDRKVVGILIAQEFDREVLAWMFDAWEELHYLSGMNWHIAVPCRPQRGNDRPERRDFDVQLSNRLREMYGISRDETPVLVLDNFNDEERQLYLRIGSSERDRKALFVRIAAFIKEHASEPYYTARGGPSMRRMLIHDLYDHVKLYDLGGAVVKFAPQVASAAVRFLRGNR